MKYECPVCSTAFKDEWKDSFDICPVCGIQFGYDDAAGGSEDLRQKIYDEWRRVWLENGKQSLSNEQQEALHQSLSLT